MTTKSIFEQYYDRYFGSFTGIPLSDVPKWQKKVIQESPEFKSFLAIRKVRAAFGLLAFSFKIFGESAAKFPIGGITNGQNVHKLHLGQE